MTEEKVVFAFAKAWNRLEPDGFLTLLSPDTRYASQWVFEELVGVAAISDYLRNKMRTVRAHSVNDPNSRVLVEIGRTAQGDDVLPCRRRRQQNQHLPRRARDRPHGYAHPIASCHRG